MTDYTLDNKSLNVVKEEKDVGIVISHDLKESAKCIPAYSKPNRMLGSSTVRLFSSLPVLC